MSLWLIPLFPFAEPTKDPLLIEAAHVEQWGEYSTNCQRLGRASLPAKEYRPEPVVKRQIFTYSRDESLKCGGILG